MYILLILSHVDAHRIIAKRDITVKAKLKHNDEYRAGRIVKYFPNDEYYMRDECLVVFFDDNSEQIIPEEYIIITHPSRGFVVQMLNGLYQKVGATAYTLPSFSKVIITTDLSFILAAFILPMAPPWPSVAHFMSPL